METNNGLYNQKQTMMQLFAKSCLGRIVIAAVSITIILFLASISIPSDTEFEQKISEDIQMCIIDNSNVRSDVIDDAVRNMTAIFTATGKNQDSTIMADFNKYNKLVIHRHTFYSTARVYNNKKIEGTRSGIGIFGMIIPTITYSDLVLNAEPVRKEYNQPLINNNYSNENLTNEDDSGNTFGTYENDGIAE